MDVCVVNSGRPPEADPAKLLLVDDLNVCSLSDASPLRQSWNNRVLLMVYHHLFLNHLLTLLE